MIEVKQPTSILERIQNIYQDYPQPFWVLMTGTFIDRLGTNLIMPFLAIYVVQRFDAKITQVGLIYTLFAISIVSFYGLPLHARERLSEKQNNQS
jgi:hypothetical protein